MLGAPRATIGAKPLGSSASPATVYKLCTDGDLPHARILNAIRSCRPIWRRS
jgi:hypothetical protein